jgi:hypothetical protein
VLEDAWENNTRGILATPLAALADGEQQGWRPSLIITPTIVEEGRPLIISNLDLVYMNQFQFFENVPTSTTLPPKRRAPHERNIPLRHASFRTADITTTTCGRCRVL